MTRYQQIASLLLSLFLLGSPVAAAEEPNGAEPLHLTMADAVRRALTASYSLIAVDKRIGDAQTQVTNSSAWLASNPFFTGGAAASSDRFTDSSQGQVPSGKEGFGPSYTFTIQQDFEIAGQRAKRMQMANESLEVVRHERRSTEASITAKVKKAFAAALESDAKLGFAQ